jgi:hypothetical protein
MLYGKRSLRIHTALLILVGFWPGGSYAEDPHSALAALSLPEKPAGLGPPLDDRAAWEAAPLKKEFILERAADLEVAEPPFPSEDLYLIFSRTGSREEYQEAVQGLRDRITILALAECLENRGRWLPLLEKDLATVLGMKTWVLPAHDLKLENFEGKKTDVDLGVAMMGWSLVTVDSWLADKLSPEIRKKLAAECLRRVVAPYEKSLAGGSGLCWWRTSPHNWNAVCHAGVLGCALALEPSREKRTKLLLSAEKDLRTYLISFEPDGYCSEGLGYWNYGFGHYAALAEMVHRQTGGALDWFRLPGVQLAALYPRKITLQPGAFPTFADGVPGTKPDLFTQLLVANRLKNPNTGPAGATGPFTWGPGLAYLVALQAFTPLDWQGGEDPLPERDEFTAGGLLISRAYDPDKKRVIWAAAMKAGHNDEAHNHNDLGTFVLATRQGMPVNDVGQEVYTARTFGPKRYESRVLGSYGHSVPLIDGKEQSAGLECNARVVSRNFTDDVDEYALDLSRAYPDTKLSSLTRTFRFHRRPEPKLEVMDEFRLRSAGTLGEGIMTLDSVEEAGPGEYLFGYARTGILLSVDSPEGPLLGKVETLDENLPKRRTAIRLGLNLEKPVTSASVRMTFGPGSIFSPACLAVMDSAWTNPALPFRKKAGNPIRLQAEALASSEGGTPETYSPKGSSGPALCNWQTEKQAISWKFEIREKGRYGLKLRFARAAPGQILLGFRVDGRVLSGVDEGFAFPATRGGGDRKEDWREMWIAQSGIPYLLDLSAGPHEITAQNLRPGGVNLDWLELVAVEAKP